MEGKVYELLILISTWSVVPASYRNGSVSLDVNGEQRLLFETVQTEPRRWMCQNGHMRTTVQDT